MTRFKLMTLLAGFLGAASIGGLALAADSAKCTIATSGNSQPARACARGGRAEAKKTMKKMVEDAKAKGQNFKCAGCHDDLDSYELTKNARADLTKLEALLAKK